MESVIPEDCRCHDEGFFEAAVVHVATDHTVRAKPSDRKHSMNIKEVKDLIHVYTRSDSAGAADTWAQFCGGQVQADIRHA